MMNEKAVKDIDRCVAQSGYGLRLNPKTQTQIQTQIQTICALSLSKQFPQKIHKKTVERSG